jgi:type I restriction enzyme, S subunit
MGVKPGFKQTEVGVIPEDWSVVPLSAITSEISDGIHATPIYSPNGGYYFINGNNIRDGRIVITDDTKTVSEPEFRKYRRSLTQRSILMSINGTIGNTGLFFGEDIVLGKSAAYLNVKHEIPRMFVYHFIQTDLVRRQFSDGVTGTTIKNLGLATIRNTLIALPSKKGEQEAIAEALSDADALIESLEQLLVKKRHLKQGSMRELLTGTRRLPGFSGAWQAKRLGEICEIVMGQSPSSAHYNNKGNGLPLIQGNADILDRRTIKRVFTTEVTKRGRRGDILMSVRAPVGEISRAGFDVCLGRGVCAIRYPNDFLYHALIFKEPTWANLSKGSTFDSVNSTDVWAFHIELPTDKAEQTAIATILSDTDAEIAALEAKLGKAGRIKQGMMQELLTGRIRLI